MSYDESAFEDPTPYSSAFASADSFRARLVMIEPTGIEHNIPKQSTQPNGAKGDRITANVTTVDGLGPVQVFSNRVGTGKMLDGPIHRKVWFNQDQIVDGLKTPEGQLRKRVLCRLETFKPGQPQGQGNPWTIVAATPEEKRHAAEFLANAILNEEDPFAPKG